MGKVEYLYVLGRLQEVGLVVNYYENSFDVRKPRWTVGNRCPIKEEFVDSIDFDEPKCELTLEHNRWVVRVHVYVLGPGLGDFEEKFTLLSEAVNSVVDYYFGNLEKVNPEKLVESLKETSVFDSSS